MIASLFCISAFAHHSIAQYDLIHGTIISGTVAGFGWENPHVRLSLQVVGENQNEEWSVELESPGVLTRLGWSKETLKPGDRITVIGSRAKDSSFRLRAGYVQWPDGKKLPALNE